MSALLIWTFLVLGCGLLVRSKPPAVAGVGIAAIAATTAIAAYYAQKDGLPWIVPATTAVVVVALAGIDRHRNYREEGDTRAR